MIYEIDMTRNYINFAPSSVVEEVMQNVRTILTTIFTEVRYLNEFALHGDVLDMPLEEVRGILTSYVIKAIKKYEKRFEVETVDFKADSMNGKIKPIVRGTINA